MHQGYSSVFQVGGSPTKLEKISESWSNFFTINKGYITEKNALLSLMEYTPPLPRFSLFSYLGGCKINGGYPPILPHKNILVINLQKSLSTSSI